MIATVRIWTIVFPTPQEIAMIEIIVPRYNDGVAIIGSDPSLQDVGELRMELEGEGEEFGGQVLPHFYCEDMMNVMNKVARRMGWWGPWLSG